MIRPSRIAIAMAGALSALSATAAATTVSRTTDAASEPPATPLPSISVKASANASPTSLGTEALKRRLDQTVGSVGFVDAASYTNSYAFTLRDVLKDAPGVFVENRYGQELRLSIRGSGIARGYHARGLDILQDGIPTNLADGSGDYYQIDPLGLQATEIY
ncbi:TonB-dependent receptor plug domain-containing protein, partial [Burkholderia gladioli]